MRKTVISALIMILALILSSCSLSMSNSIDELITAPALSEKQSSVLSTLTTDAAGSISFVYPVSGADRSAIRSVDLDNDGQNEVLAFYLDSGEDVNAIMAVLERKEDGTYYIADKTFGIGDSIASFSFVSGTTPLLITEWTSRSKTSNSLNSYIYENETLELGFEENCLKLTTIDIDDNGSSEFCYVAKTTSDTGYNVKLVSVQEDGLNVEGVIALDDECMNISGLYTGITDKNKTSVFVDEITSSGLQTEVFSLNNSGMFSDAAYSGGYDVVSLSKRENDGFLVSSSLNGILHFPSRVKPSTDTPDINNMVYWYTISDGEIVLGYSTLYSSDYQFAMSLPDHWLSDIRIIHNDNTPKEFTVVSNEDGSIYADLFVVDINGSADGLVADGYRLIANSGVNRYYVRFSCSEEDKQYIKDNFFVF